MNNLLSLAITMVLLLAGPSGKSSNPWKGPDKSFPIALKMRLLEEGDFRKDDPIRVRVDIVNNSTEPIMACIEEWPVQIGIVSFEMFDENHERVRILSEEHADFPIEEERHLVLLEPGERKSGILEVTRRARKYDVSKGQYFLIAKYRCPFKGSRVINGRSIAIASGRQYSVPTSISIRE